MSGLAADTHRTYGVGQRRYLRFAREYRLTIKDILPASPDVLLMFAASLFAEGRLLAYATAKGYLAHVKALHEMLGLEVSAFFCSRLRLAFRGYRRRRPASKAKSRLPITISLLGAFMEILDLDIHQHLVIAAAITVGVYGLFRSGELTAKVREGSSTCPLLTRSHVKWEDDRFTIRLESSKTDPFREGVDVMVNRNNSLTCPWATLRQLWITAPDQSNEAPLFQLEDGQPLMYKELNTAIKALAQRVGLDPSLFAGHSLRIGGATSLAMLGYHPHVIKALGRWSSLTYQEYARLTGSMRASISAALAQPAKARERNYFGGIDPATVAKSSFEDIHFAFNAKHSA